MSSLSMATLTTTSHSHHPSEPLLHSTAYQEMLARQPLHPDAPHVAWSPDLLFGGDPVPRAEERGYWEMKLRRRLRRLRLLKGVLLSIIGSWASYTTVRYLIAYVTYSESTRQSVALALGISSVLSFFVAAALALSILFPSHVTHDHPRLRSLGKALRHTSQYLTSFFLFAPAAINLALVFVWRDTGSDLSLRGRCHWDLDVTWVGVGGQCGAHSPVFGVWLAAAVSRLVLTTGFLVAYHISCQAYRASRRSTRYRPEDVQQLDTTEVTQTAEGGPSRPSLVLRPVFQQDSSTSTAHPRFLPTSQMAVIPEFSEAQRQARHQTEHGYTVFGSEDDSTISEESASRSTETASSQPRSLRRVKSSREMQTAEGSSRHAALANEAEEGQLQGFADRFRALVDRVSRELEDGMNVEPQPDLRTPPLHHVLDTHTPYMSIDEFGREVPSEERIAVLGGVIKRMPTIESVGSRELTSLRSATLVSSGGIATSPATPSPGSSRPPTRATMISLSDAASASLASASQPPSRSNSLQKPRMASELGELVRDSAGARSVVRGSGPSSASTRGSNGEGSSSAPPRSRSNSLGPGEVLAPVTELGELGREGSAAAIRCDTPEQGASEMGELVVRVEGARSAASTPSASTAYYTAGTHSSGTSSGAGAAAGGAPLR
ncbi:hypothetical protein BC834DRAFT_971467 [Gloeopeniophorella convolvens]|nr:hypothetical protein BC834DRAFT_971467 [Gloeopeniophorella convolvens]